MTESPTFYVGAMSGTSVDGLDLALISVSGEHIGIEAGRTVAFPATLTTALLDLAAGRDESLDALALADRALGDVIGGAINTFLSDLGCDRSRVRAIGSHGQTVRHRPNEPHRFTLQIGDPNQIAEKTGIDTVADFRRRDVAAGGQGAPLVAPFHEALFRSRAEDRVLVNIGGIANATYLSADPATPVIGFDTGPGNTLLDRWIARHRGLRYDAGGDWARSGIVSRALLDALSAHPYFDRPAPKSTGPEEFSLAWLDAALVGRAVEPADVQATLVALTATAIARGVRGIAAKGTTVILCGGGRHNRALVDDLAAALPEMSIRATEDYGYDGDFIEAAAFAWLARLRVDGRAGNLPNVTGACGGRVLGGLYPGR